MKPNFALLLSFDGLRLLHRVSNGWHLVGEVPVDSPDLSKALSLLRRTAIDLDPRGLRTKLLIPNDQIRYMALDTTRASEDDVRAALDGATPYAVNDLVYDYVRGGGRTYIAAIARETLDEAEAFAREHKFAPVCFAAVPEEFTYAGEAFFGPTKVSVNLIGPNETVERDAEPVRIVGKAHLPKQDDPAEDTAVMAVSQVAVEPPAAAEPPGPTVAEDAPTSPPTIVDADPVVEPPAPADVTTGLESEPATDDIVEPAPLPSADLDVDSAEPPAVLRDPVLEDLGTPDIPVPEPSDGPITPGLDQILAVQPPTDGSPTDPVEPVTAADGAVEPVFASRARPLRASEPLVAPSAIMPPVVAPAPRVPPRSSGGPAAAVAKAQPFERAEPVFSSRARADLTTPPQPSLRAVTMPGAGPVPQAPAPVAETGPVASEATSLAVPVAVPAPVVGLQGADRSADAAGSAPLRPVDTAAPVPASAPAVTGVSDAALPPDARPRKTATVTALRPKDEAAPALTAPPRAQPAALPATAEDDEPTERDRLTVFGARKGPVRGKPRFLGLILTVILLLFLAAVAALAATKGPQALAWLLGRGVATTEVAATTNVAPDAALQTSVQDEQSADLADLGIPAAADQGPADLTAASDLAPLAADLSAADPAAETSAATAAPTPAEPTLSANPDVVASMAGALAALTAADQAAAPVGNPPTMNPVATAAPAEDTPGAAMSPAEAERIYAATGVWQRAPRLPLTPRSETADDVRVAAIDPVSPSRDAVALPDAAVAAPDLALVTPPNPPAPGVTFARDANGFVLATPEGTLTPDGIVVYAGKPSVVPPVRPGTQTDAAAEVAADAPLPITPGGVALASFRPQERPTDLVEQTQRSTLNGRSLDELSRIRPTARPPGLAPAPAPEPPPVEAAAPASENPAPDNPVPDVAAIAAAIAASAPPDLTAGATRLAIAASPRPDSRPRNFARVVQAATPAPRQVAAAAVAPAPQVVAPATSAARIPPVVASPSGPVPGGVARAATEANVLNLRQLNLIGVYGASNARTALIRTSRGQYVRVTVGDRLDGGQVVAIGENALSYVKRGRTYTLQMPPA